MGAMCDNFIIYEDNKNEFQIWQGLIGAHYTPHVDSIGNLSWTNNGDLPNPQTVNISGRGLTITGVVATVGDLPETASNYDTYLVGSDEEYFAYLYYNGSWVNLGTVGRGEKGDTGDPATVTSETTVYQQGDSGTTPPSGTWSSTVPTVAQGKFLWTRTTLEFNTGDPLVWYAVAYQAIDGQGSPGTATPLVDSGNGVVGTATSYSREDHQHPLNVPTSGTPEMDGTASQGSATTYARADHVHPTDTSRASQTDMTTAQGNITSLQSGKADASAFKGFTVTLSSSGWSSNAQTVSDAKFIASGYSYIVSPASASFADYGAAQIYADDVSTDGSMTFHCTDAPSSNLTVNIVRVVAT